MIVVDASRYNEEDLLIAIDAGAQDISLDDDVFEITSAPGDLGAVRRVLTAAGSKSSPPIIYGQPPGCRCRSRRDQAAPG